MNQKFPYIYLIFDFEYQDKLYKDKFPILKEMLEYFDDETENGLLLINYPMIESYRDFKSPINIDEYREKHFSLNPEVYRTLYNMQNKIRYKGVVEKRGTCIRIDDYTKELFNSIILQNIMKINYICSEKYLKPNYNIFIEQVYGIKVLEKQFEKINKEQSMYVLCCGILITVIFFGENYFDKIE